VLFRSLIHRACFVRQRFHAMKAVTPGAISHGLQGVPLQGAHHGGPRVW
jgi:hypothetical protein